MGKKEKGSQIEKQLDLQVSALPHLWAAAEAGGGGGPSGTRPHPQCLFSEAGALRAAPPAGVLCDRWEEKWGYPRFTPPRTQCRASWAWRVGKRVPSAVS